MNSMTYRAAAKALEDLEAVSSWSDRSQFGRATVSWEWGSLTNGYKELKAEIEAIVTERMPDLAAEAIQRVKARADAAVAATRDGEGGGHA